MVCKLELLTLEVYLKLIHYVFGHAILTFTTWLFKFHCPELICVHAILMPSFFSSHFY